MFRKLNFFECEGFKPTCLANRIRNKTNKPENQQPNNKIKNLKMTNKSTTNIIKFPMLFPWFPLVFLWVRSPDPFGTILRKPGLNMKQLERITVAKVMDLAENSNWVVTTRLQEQSRRDPN